MKETAIAEHVRQRLAKDKAEKERRRKEKEEAHLFVNVRIATDADMRAQIGASLTFDLVDFEKVGQLHAFSWALSLLWRVGAGRRKLLANSFPMPSYLYHYQTTPAFSLSHSLSHMAKGLPRNLDKMACSSGSR